jgi:arylformamidase
LRGRPIRRSFPILPDIATNIDPMRLIDITRPVHEGMAVWPGDMPYGVEWTLRLSDGGSVNLSALHLSAHTGTHADAPYHVADDGARIGEAPLSSYIGPARVVDARRWESIDLAAVEPLLGPGVQRLLFRTGCWRDPRTFPERFAPIAPDAARAMADAGVVLVGTDAPSVDPFDSTTLETHHVLRAAGVVNLENLLLDEAEPGEYELVALPLRLDAACASPVRAVLRVV